MDAFRRRLASFIDSPVTIRDAALFSDLDRAQVAEMRRLWPRLPLEARRKLVAEMVELAEERIEYNFGRALRVTLYDTDATVRVSAIEGLWEDAGDDVLRYLLDEALADADAGVRLAAVRALARYSALVVEEALDLRWYAPLRNHLLRLAREGESDEVRRRALEAVAVYSTDEEVLAEIGRAYASPDLAARMSALYAMGRNLDERWLDTVINELDNPEAGMRYEATKASGAFGDRRAVPRLIERLGDDDREVRLAAVGALGAIGGNASVTILKRLAVSKDDAVREAAEEALEEATFMSNPIAPGQLGLSGGERE